MNEDFTRDLGVREHGDPIQPGGVQAGVVRSADAAKVRTAVEGLGDLMDDYEFHYPQELRATTSTRCSRRSTGTASTASRAACTSTRGSARAASPRPTTRHAPRRSRLTLEGIDLAGELGAHFIIWPGIEGYNYPFQTPYAASWQRFVDGVGEAAQHAETRA